MEIFLTNNDLTKLKKIGQGTDGSVYLYQKNLLIKLYHNKVHKITNISNDEDIKIYQKDKIKPNNFYQNDLNYYTYSVSDKDQIKLIPKESIKKAIDRQEEIKLTSLPIGIVYLNNHFAGCVLQKQKGIAIHKLTGLPLHLRKKIYLNILKALYELFIHNIYHIDLSNSPFVKKEFILPNSKIINTGHSHVLVNPLSLKTHFIDLEGKSTIYTEIKSPELLRESLDHLNILTLEFLLQADYEEHKEYLEELDYDLKQKEIPTNFRDKLIANTMNLEDYYELTRILKR